MAFTPPTPTPISAPAPAVPSAVKLGRRDSLVSLLEDVELPLDAVPILMLARALSEETTAMDSGLDSDPDCTPPANATMSDWSPGIFEAAFHQPFHQHQQQLPAMQTLLPKQEQERRGAFAFEASGLEYGYGTGSDSDGAVTPPTPTAYGAQLQHADQSVYRPRQLATLAPQERKQRKQASNRRAAQKFREKKKLELSHAFAIIATLQHENAAMQDELRAMRQ